jgi:hypothetical protein
MVWGFSPDVGLGIARRNPFFVLRRVAPEKLQGE